MNRTEPTLYEILEVDQTASIDEIKRAYRRQALKYHPDKNPDGTEQFKKISGAFEILSNPRKRQKYDASLRNHSAFSTSSPLLKTAMNIFATFMSAMQGLDIVQIVDVTLEELYTGVTKNIKVEKLVICSKCRGTGCKSGVPIKCRSCKGSGRKVVPEGFFTTILSAFSDNCENCNGIGTAIPLHDKCETCNAEKLVSKIDYHQINILAGMEHDSTIVYERQANQKPGKDPGHLIFKLNLLKHETFERSNGDLIYKINVTLTESICGFKKQIKTLDGRFLKIVWQPNDNLIENEMQKTVPNEGMPIKTGSRSSQTSRKGDLKIIIKIIYPCSIKFKSSDSLDALRKILDESFAYPSNTTFDAVENQKFDHEFHLK